MVVRVTHPFARAGREIVPGHDGPLMTNAVIEYLQKIKTVRTGIEGRIVFKQG